MSDKHTDARKKYWEGIKPEERTKRMSAVAATGWAKVSKAERRKRALKMVEARKKKA